MIYFTSDLHIGHDKDFIWKKRGFSSIEEHNKEILKRWNEVIKSEDTVYILGDLTIRRDNSEKWDSIFYHLNGKISVIQGNHDSNHGLSKYENDYRMNLLGLAFEWYYDKEHKFYLSHYPTIVGDEHSKRFFWNLSGHTHSQNKFEFGQHYIYNVGVDAHNCYPISVEQIIKDINKYKGVK